MTQGILQTDVYTDFQGINTLRNRARTDGDSEETLRKVAEQFEALFLQMMLKSMRDASLGDGMLDNEHTKTYQAMFDKQISIEMSQGQGIGLADMMVEQLRKQGDGDSSLEPGELQMNPAQSIDRAGENFRFPVQQHTATTAKPDATRESDDWVPESPKEFIHKLWPHAKRAADEIGAKPEMLIAQAALETGWGQHMIRGKDGSNSFNLFGIKADSGWQGARATTETIEFRDGLMRKERAHFRAYASPEESFADYIEFLKRNPRYSDALQRADDAPEFTRALTDAGYATDPDYAGKINRIMDSSHLREALGEVDVSAAGPRG
ncbi:flagellar protein FlgJ [Thiogranum longum]|uniref:Peptidoglycan hydrolase FlgJ n=1 Tax=Thiogranum longum TaxID=1537524 RepID=A0A4R1HDZ2_9GAMM|nr:flagellar assembly peptidoglycan hydrolase FlgJ [Thiogranum longum]TCK18863.1 flagellar protein FlgJ [Thiogranum longum]